MINNLDALKDLIERENVLVKVGQLIDLKYNYYSENATESSEAILESLAAIRSRLSIDNSLQVLQMLLDEDFINMQETQIIEALS